MNGSAAAKASASSTRWNRSSALAPMVSSGTIVMSRVATVVLSSSPQLPLAAP
jgi:hypothetical protein